MGSKKIRRTGVPLLSTARHIAGVAIPPLFGHVALQERLARAARSGALPASLLLHGPRGVGKQRLALWLGGALLCSSETARPCGQCRDCRYVQRLTHPDLRWIFPTPRPREPDPAAEDVFAEYAETIAERVAAGLLYEPPAGTDGIFVATVRALVRYASVTPALARRKVIVVGDAERLVQQEGSDVAANAMLKLLEEPLADTTLILTSSEPGALLPTIRSRVVAVRVAPHRDSEVGAFVADATVRATLDARGVPAGDAERIRLARGAPGTLLAGGAAPARAAALALLDAARSPRPADRYRAAFLQGGAGARGGFSDTLDALTVLLAERTGEAIRRNDAGAARRTAEAVAAVELTKARASGNVSPQLLAVALLPLLASPGVSAS